MASQVTPSNPDPLLNVPITPELVEKHGLTPEEYKLIQDILGREPNLARSNVRLETVFV